MKFIGRTQSGSERRRTKLKPPQLIALIISSVLIVVVIVSADSFARQRLQEPTQETDYNYRMQRPPAYQQSAYWSPAFINEQEGVNAVSGAGLPDYDHANFSGQWFNVTKGVRRTVNQPDNAEHTMYLFGSSTTFDTEVPDEYTIASFLQKLVGTSYRVENLGASGYTVLEEYFRLEQTPIHKGDVVIFYDGVTDVAWISGKAFQQWQLQRQTSLGCRTGSAIITLLLCPQALTIDETDYPRALSDYQTNLYKARVYATVHGAVFYHILQPQLWSRPLTPVEADLSQIIPDGPQTVLTHMWPQMEATPNTIDLTHVLDTVRDKEAVYLDYDHVNEVGNSLIAQAIYDAITVF